MDSEYVFNIIRKDLSNECTGNPEIDKKCWCCVNYIEESKCKKNTSYFEGYKPQEYFKLDK